MAGEFDKSNDAVIALAALLRDEGIAAVARKPETEYGRYSLSIRTSKGEALDVKSLDRASGYGSRRSFEFAGFYIRYDWEGKRGMGSIRYPLKKDGTVDVARLKGDIESYERRAASRNEIADKVLARKEKMKLSTALLQEEVNKRLGGGIFIEVENDGMVDDAVKFKISGRADPAQVYALISLLKPREEVRAMGPVFSEPFSGS